MSGPPQQMIGNQVVHVRGDSDSDLEALFKAVMNPSEYAQLPQGVPFRQRQLPSSFFKEPEPQQTKGQSSREGSVEGSYRSPSVQSPPPGSLPINHPRAHSSPATLQQTLRAAAPPPAPQHPRQRSYDGLVDEGPLPPGWDVATHEGQRYFLKYVLECCDSFVLFSCFTQPCFTMSMVTFTLDVNLHCHGYVILQTSNMPHAHRGK